MLFHVQHTTVSAFSLGLSWQWGFKALPSLAASYRQIKSENNICDVEPNLNFNAGVANPGLQVPLSCLLFSAVPVLTVDHLAQVCSVISGMVGKQVKQWLSRSRMHIPCKKRKKIAMENTGNPARAGTAISAPNYECTDWSLAWNTKRKEKYSFFYFK